MFLHSAIQAGTYLAAKRALGELSAFELALARFTLSGAAFGALLWHRRVRVARADLPALAALGVVAIPLNQGLFLTGLTFTTAGHAALLYALTPIFVLLLSRARLGERATLAKAAGIAVAFAGVVVVLFARSAVSLGGPASLRASAGRTYRVPSFAELYLQQGVVAPNPELRPEVGVGGDGALVLEGGLGLASVGAFATRYDDLVVYQSVSFRRLAPVNADRVAMRGLEVELAGAPLARLAGLAAALSYTFTDSENLRGVAGVVGKDVTRRPRHRLYGRLGAGGPAADAHAEVQLVSRQFLDLANRGVVPASLTFGAGDSVRVLRAPDVRLSLEVRNLLDDRSLQDSYGYPLPGRTVFVTLRAGPTETRRTP